MTYSISPQGYLARARDLLLSNDPPSIFYAALELRCCVESRQADYLEALEFYRGIKIKPWQIGQTSRKLLEVWKNPKIAKLTYRFADREFETFFTPVKPTLARAVEKELGSLLHAQSTLRNVNDAWWAINRCRLIEIYREAWVACRGEHMAPPLWKASSREAHPMRLYARPETADLVVRLLLLAKSESKNFVLSIDYLEEPPEDWECGI
jgi:hypothetical protein